MTDKFRARSSGLSSPGHSAADIVPADGTDLAVTSRALYVGGAGDLRVTMAGGQTVTFANLAPGILPVRVRRVHATGTTASGIVALW
ncbi:MAG TPA: hypothetical protein VMM55_08950 [Thermohalobaculum sp.]|nr:hypothetical protein [Thermohalobaculum sp.]